jgi:hypothetical protein
LLNKSSSLAAVVGVIKFVVLGWFVKQNSGLPSDLGVTIFVRNRLVCTTKMLA